MPSSHFHQLNEIVELIVLTDPQSILDVGVGFGKYGFLSREYLELLGGKSRYNDWKRQIDGIEVFEKYLTPIHNLIYNQVYVGNTMDILPTLKTRYDLILLIDVLEHLNHEEGVELLEECKKRGRNIIISTPKDIGSQKDTFDNPFETHKSQWRKEHFDKNFANTFFVPNEYSLICYAGDDIHQVRVDYGKFRVKSKIKKHLPFLRTPYRAIKRIARYLP